MISWPYDKTRAGPMNSERHTDFLLMLVFVLASVCFTRWLYIETPDAPYELRSQLQADDWAPPLQ